MKAKESLPWPWFSATPTNRKDSNSWVFLSYLSWPAKDFKTLATHTKTQLWGHFWSGTSTTSQKECSWEPTETCETLFWPMWMLWLQENCATLSRRLCPSSRKAHCAQTPSAKLWCLLFWTRQIVWDGERHRGLAAVTLMQPGSLNWALLWDKAWTCHPFSKHLDSAASKLLWRLWGVG